MSRRVRELLKQMGLYYLTTHEDRLEIDREIGRRTGLSCDEGVERLSREEFEEIVRSVLWMRRWRRKKRKKEVRE